MTNNTDTPPSSMEALHRDITEQNARRFFCFGFSLWKQGFVRRYLYSPDGDVQFVRRIASIQKAARDPKTRIVVWGQNATPRLKAFAAAEEIPLYCMEDGFLRSIGLGSDLTVPASLVLDTRGIYYDPTRPSDLEDILQNHTFNREETERAARLRRMMVDLNISKYNLTESDPFHLPNPRPDRVILVPGQVEDDASIQLGTVDVRTNHALLTAVRKAHPDACILFKPHPDVVSGNRKGNIPRTEALRLADDVIEAASIGSCLHVATEVHTMTSLVGFEALLRGLPVTTYGSPFYAGWGLTTDRHPVSRRTRQLTMDQLVSGTLCRYPRYVDPETFAFTTPEKIVLQLQRARTEATEKPIQIRTWRPLRQFKRLIHLIKALRNAD